MIMGSIYLFGKPTISISAIVRIRFSSAGHGALVQGGCSLPNFDLVSDLHLDMRPRASRLLSDIDPMSNTLVIAGDLCEARSLKAEWLHILSKKYKNIIYTPGNHEFYGSNFENTIRTLADAMRQNWYLLYNSSIYVEGIMWAGTTLWFPNQNDNVFYEHAMTDFSLIGGYRSWVYREHSKAKTFLAKACGCDVWVLHHLPFWRSVHPKYTNSGLNRFFVGDISRELEANNTLPKVIVHGHTHEPCDYIAGDVRVVCNPFGYPNEGSASIQPIRVSFSG